jgi:glutamate dehydrogenase (NAD(P)+)
VKEIQSEIDALQPQFVGIARDRSVGLEAYVVVDATVAGHSCGGLRLGPTVSIDQVKALAHGMTLKYGFSGVPQGGSKAGIVGDPEMSPEQKRPLMQRLGEILAPLLRSGYYISGPDMSISTDDIRVMIRSAHVKVPHARLHKGKKSGFHTALAVKVSMEACAEARGLNLAGATLAIEGFGSVGSALAHLMASQKGSRVVAVSTSRGAIYAREGLDIDELLRLREIHGNSCVLKYAKAERIPHEQLLLLDVDILSPCAEQYAIHTGNAHALKCRIIAPGANNPVTLAAESILHGRDILSVPYFVANCGGVLGNKMEVLGMGAKYIESMIRKKNHRRILELIEISRNTGELMMTIAERYALHRFSRIQRLHGRDHNAVTLYSTALRFFKTGLVPEALLKPFGPIILERTMGRDPSIKGGV